MIAGIDISLPFSESPTRMPLSEDAEMKAMGESSGGAVYHFDGEYNNARLRAIVRAGARRMRFFRLDPA